MNHRKLLASLIVLLPLLAACATLPEKNLLQAAVGIGHFEAFSGRLIVIEPSRRWQVTLQWQAKQASTGWARLTHAASNTVIELRWQGDAIQLRGNGRASWQSVSREALSKQGIVLTPQQLATLLLGGVPTHFQAAKTNQSNRLVWENRGFKPFIRVQWQAEQQRLTMTDITHGRRAILIITP